MRQSGKFRLFCVLLSTAFLAACGGDGGGSSTSSPSTSTPSVSGVVADGYLVGATVCSDQNLNKQCDDGEPIATTEAGGAYTLEGDDLDLYPLVVEVTATVIDEDTGTAVGKPYIMSAPIPANLTAEQVVTPITTLVQNLIDTDQTLTRTEAADAVKAKLGVGADVDLFEDFVAQDSAEYDLLHATARVIASVMADSQDAMAAAAEARGVSTEDLIAEIVNQVMDQLETIVADVVDAQTSAGDTFDPADLDITTVPVEVADTEDIEGVANLNAYGITSSGRWGGSYIQARNYEASVGSNTKAFIAYTNQTGEALDSVITKVEMYSGNSLLGTQTSAILQNQYVYNCLGVSCAVTDPYLEEYAYFFSVAGPLAAGTYEFDTTLTDAGATVLTTAVDYPGDLQLPYINSSTQTATWVDGNLVLSWDAAVGDNLDMVDRLQLVISIPNDPERNELYVKLPVDAISVELPAELVAPFGLAPGINGYADVWQMQTRAYDAARNNYARGISKKVRLPGIQIFTTEWLNGKTLYDVWFGSTNQVNDSAGVDKMVFDSTNITITSLLNGDAVDGVVPYEVTNGKLHEAGDATEENTIVCSTADFIEVVHTVNGTFDNIDRFYFDQTAAMDFAATLSGTIPSICQ